MSIAYHLTLQKFVSEGEKYPRGYGYAYYDFMRDCKIAYPIPINLIVRYTRSVWVWITIKQRGRAWYEKRWMIAWRLGCARGQRTYQRICQREVLDAYNRGWQEGRDKMREEIYSEFQELTNEVRIQLRDMR